MYKRAHPSGAGLWIHVAGSRPRTTGVPRSSRRMLFFFFFTLVTGPGRSLSLKMSDTRVYEPQIRARLGTAAHFCRVVVLKLRTVQVTDWWEPEHGFQLYEVAGQPELDGSIISRYLLLSSSLLLSSLQVSDSSTKWPASPSWTDLSFPGIPLSLYYSQAYR